MITKEEAKRLMFSAIGEAVDEFPEDTWPLELKGLFETVDQLAENAINSLVASGKAKFS